MQNRYDIFEGLENFVPSTKFTDCLCLFMKTGGNGVNGLERVPIFMLFREWMIDPTIPVFFS